MQNSPTTVFLSQIILPRHPSSKRGFERTGWTYELEIPGYPKHFCGRVEDICNITRAFQAKNATRGTSFVRVSWFWRLFYKRVS